MSAGNSLGEYTGHIVRETRENPLKKRRYCVKYFQDDEVSYFVDATKAGNETRFIRRTENVEEANVAFTPLWIEGRLRIFLEIIKGLEPNDEIIVKGIPIESIEEPGINSQENYTYTMNLIWDQVTEVERNRFDGRTMEELSVIERISKSGHPCDGQLGLIATRDFENGEYLGEYTGRVLVNAVFPEGVFSIYLMDFSTGYDEDLGTVWIDAQEEGNEMRFINDYRNIEAQPNVQFKKMWLDYRLRVFIQLTAPVKCGEEFLADYGESYWTTLKDLESKKKQLDEEIQ